MKLNSIEKGFTPFQLNLTVETIEEARLLYHVFSVYRLKRCIFGEEYGGMCDFNLNETEDHFMNDDIVEYIVYTLKRQGYKI